jgi:hypothetical protein
MLQSACQSVKEWRKDTINNDESQGKIGKKSLIKIGA